MVGYWVINKERSEIAKKLKIKILVADNTFWLDGRKI
jgi:hypothetical protein